MKLKYKLAIFFLLAAALPAFTTIFIFQTQFSDILVKDNLKNSMNIAAERTQSIDNFFSNLESGILGASTSSRVIEYLETVTGSNYWENKSQNLMLEIAEKLDSFTTQYPEIQSISLLPGKEGVPIYRGYTEIELAKDFKHNNIYLDSIAEPDHIFWLLRKEKEGDDYALSLAKGIVDRYSDHVVGVLVVRVVVSEYFADFNSMRDNPNPFVVTNADKEIIYSQNAQGILDHFQKQLRQMGDLSRNETFEMTTEGTIYVAVGTTSMVSGWKLFYLSDKSEIVSSVNRVSGISVIVAILFTVFSLFGALYLYLRIYNPISRLTASMKKIEKGNLDLEVSVQGRDEISMLEGTFNDLMGEVKDLLQKTEETQKKKARMEIKALQAQITPHFLYNTLNSIQSLVRLGKNQDATEMVGALIDLLRLSASEGDMITIEEELNYVTAYAKIMSYRSSIPFVLKVHAQSGRECAIPKFSIQPLVENCILHGFCSSEINNACITIRVQELDSWIRIEVEDNGVGIEKHTVQDIYARAASEERESRRYSGIGIENVLQKLRLEFSEKAQMTIQNNVPHGTTVVLEFPRVLLPNNP